MFDDSENPGWSLEARLVRRRQSALLYAFPEKDSRKPVENPEKRYSQAGCSPSATLNARETLQTLTDERDFLCDASKKSRWARTATA
jgi:hypothetical protein